MYKVLVVDDERWVYDDLSALIDWNEYGFELIGLVENPALAEVIVKNIKPDLIISDIQMPKISGLELISNLRKAGYQNEIVILTAYSDFEYAKEAIKSRVLEYLLKPVEADALCEVLVKVREHLGGEEGVEHSGKSTEMILEIMLDDIQHRYSERLTLSDYAKQYHLNPNYLTQAFSGKVGESFTEKLIGKRIEIAKDLLRETEYNLMQIGEMVGYEDYFQFSKIFKKYVGMPPSEYRNCEKPTKS